MSEWWLSRGDGKTEGPLSTDALVHGLVAGQIPKRAHVCRVGDQKWVRVSEIDEIWEAANPEQIRTNITEQPWFLNHSESGQHRLADAEAEDERTQVLTPLPMVTPNGANHSFVTPLPRSGMHRELLARQQGPNTPNVAPLPHVATAHVEQQALQANAVAPIRAKVPTLDGISNSSPPDTSREPTPQPQGSMPQRLDAKPPRAPERPAIGPAQTAHHPQSPEQKAPNLAPLPQAVPGQHAPNLGPLPGAAMRPGLGAPSGLAPLGAVRPLANVPNTSGAPVGIPSLQSPTTPTGTVPVGTQPSPPHQQSQPSLPGDQAAREASRQDALPALPTLHQAAARPRAVTPAQPPLAAQPRFAVPPAVPPRGAPSGAAATSPSMPAPSLMQPRPLSFGPGLPPATLRQNPTLPAARLVAAAPVRVIPVIAPTSATTGAPANLPNLPSTETDELELELTEEDELTTIAQTAALPSQPFEANPDDEELTTIAGKLSPRIQAPKVAPTATRRKHLPPTPVSDATSDDESTAIVCAADLPGGRRLVPAEATVTPSDEEPTMLVRTRVAPGPAIQAEPAYSNPQPVVPKRGTAETAPNPFNVLPRAATGGVAAATESLVSDPEDLLEEGDDEPQPSAEVHHVVPAARSPNLDTKLAPITAAQFAVAPLSAPPPARRPRLPSAPSIVLKPEPIIHQEATQPAARAMRRPGTVKLSFGTMIIILLALALVVLAVAYFLLRRA